MKKTVRATFVKTAVWPEDYPVIRNLGGAILPEIAVVGRSNVGKSSLLNTLFQSKDLVKTSSTPGKTQHLNFFKFNNEMSFADLPGYGYAMVPSSVKKQWGPMVRAYLEKRESLGIILFLLDIRRIPNEEDMQFIEWALHHEKPFILVLTKIDKVNQKEMRIYTQRILDALNLDDLHYIHFSVPKRRGERELMALLHEAIAS
jgi:GTP-binding protein